jgi:hypothetical protein
VDIATSLRDQGLDEPALQESRARLRHSLEVTIDGAADLCGVLCSQAFFDGDQPSGPCSSGSPTWTP